jgi:hypothetical protein
MMSWTKVSSLFGLKWVDGTLMMDHLHNYRWGGRTPSRAHYGEVESYITNHNESASSMLDRFASMGTRVLLKLYLDVDLDAKSHFRVAHANAYFI